MSDCEKVGSTCTGKQQPRKADLPCLYTVKRFWGDSARDRRNLLKLLTLLKKKKNKKNRIYFLFFFLPPKVFWLLSIFLQMIGTWKIWARFHYVFNLSSILPFNQRLNLIAKITGCKDQLKFSSVSQNSVMGQKGINDSCLWIAEGTAANQILDCHQSDCHAERGSWASLSGCAVHRAEGPG